MKNIACPICGSLSFIKKGYYTTKHNHQPVPRYKCKDCHANFSSHSNRETFGQHRPDLNQQIFELASSSVTMRRIAIVAKCSRLTVERKLIFIAEQARLSHEQFLSQKINETKSVHFDEMETYQHTKCKPLSIALAVDNESGDIIDAQVAKMRCKGKLATISANKYPEWNTDNRKEASLRVIHTIKKMSCEDVVVISDGKKVYPDIIHAVLPMAQVVQHVKKKAKYDPLFTINHTSAKIRADLSRMRRRTWATTKKWQNLQRHLLIYIAWNNGYALKLNFC
jgi:transposase-like protein